MEQVSRRRLTESDLAGRSQGELRLIRNTPYARHGYRFKDSNLTAYFQQKSWYHPVSGDADVAWKQMSETERYNVALLRNYQQKQGGR